MSAKRPRAFLALLFFLMIALPTASTSAAQQPSLESVRQDIEDFKRSPDYALAPATTARAEAYLGAALLAQEQHKDEDAAAALQSAARAIAEARATAQTFRRTFASLLQHQESAEAALAALEKEGVLFSPENDPRPLLAQAEDALASAVNAMEQGRLNASHTHAADAERLYQRALDILLPILADQTAEWIHKASSAGAKRYAPQTLQSAKANLIKLRAYNDGLSEQAPEQPALALAYARAALALTNQIKEWRKNPGAFEELILKQRKLKAQLAEHLHLRVDLNDPTVDITPDELLQAVDSLQTALQKERNAHQADIKRLQEACKAELEAKISEQRQACLEEKNTELRRLKDTFRAKLERETFESKRQAAVRELFKPGEANILADLDGSLLIRLTGLKFRPNESKIDRRYYDLLSRLKQALDIYGDREALIEGHTDNQGDAQYNRILSLKRAEAVRDFLIAAGINGARLKALGYGEAYPIASNEFAKGREMNRRIDIRILAANRKK